MTERSKTKGTQTIYWISTSLLCAGMLYGGIAQFMKAEFQTQGIVRLGYPIYFMRFIGIWKVAGVITLLIPGYTLLKEWAYAGFLFLMSGAVISHIAFGDSLDKWVAPLVFTLLVLVSWAVRPVTRRLSIAT